MQKLGHVFGSTFEYPMALFAGDLAAATAWDGNAPILEPKYKGFAAVKLEKLRAAVFDIGGLAHVALGFRDADTLMFVEDTSEEPDVATAAFKRASALAGDPGALLTIATIDVPSGILVIGEAWKDYDGDPLEGGKAPAGAKARSLDDEALVVSVTPGVYTIARRKIAEGTAGIVRIAR